MEPAGVVYLTQADTEAELILCSSTFSSILASYVDLLFQMMPGLLVR